MVGRLYQTPPKGWRFTETPFKVFGHVSATDDGRKSAHPETAVRALQLFLGNDSHVVYGIGPDRLHSYFLRDAGAGQHGAAFGAIED